MLYALGVIIFAVGLVASIALHEVGHMVPAKRFGVKVTQYMVGFGPTIFSRRRGDTEYGVKALPLGGYIRMIGMVPPRQDDRRSRWPTRLATAVEEFRAASRTDVVDAADEPRQFYRLTPGKKMIVMIGGPSMNLLIYVILTLLLYTAMGNPTTQATTTVASVVQCVVPATSPDATDSTCPADQTRAPRAPAYGVLQPGDQLLAIGSTKVSSWDDAVSIIEASAGRQLQLTIKRAGQVRTVDLTPVKNVKYANDTGTKTKVAGYIGVQAASRTYFAGVGLTQIPGKIVGQLATGFRALGSYPSKIGSLWDTVFEGKARDPNGAVGVVGLGEIGGQIAEDRGISAEVKIFDLLSLLASVNLLLFLFNLLPLLPLDGGHVAGAMVEASRRGRARLRDRSAARTGDEGATVPTSTIYVDTAQMIPVMYAVASVLLVLTALVVYADFVKPIHLT